MREMVHLWSASTFGLWSLVSLVVGGLGERLLTTGRGERAGCCATCASSDHAGRVQDSTGPVSTTSKAVPGTDLS
jgi:hypothetical protein